LCQALPHHAIGARDSGEQFGEYASESEDIAARIVRNIG
jgi:hypothetical protein